MVHLTTGRYLKNNLIPHYFGELVGVGSCTTAPAAPGSLLLADPILLCIPPFTNLRPWELQVLDEYEKLSDDAKEQYLKLKEDPAALSYASKTIIAINHGIRHESHEQLLTKFKVMGIFLTNKRTIISGDNRRMEAVFLRFSRINHSCTPNACETYCPESRKLYVHAMTDLQKGEEVRVAYRNITAPYAFRTRVLPFLCFCSTCITLSNRQASDIRRLEILRMMPDLSKYAQSVPATSPYETWDALDASFRFIALVREERLFELLSYAHQKFGFCYIQMGLEEEAKREIRLVEEHERICRGHLFRPHLKLRTLFEQKFGGRRVPLPSEL
ncbi:hypothetical protein F4801DRAFT_583211 [Xylaria longipes]|nr:hypothetical protein F4801DRAFT_583211 [Xylaria longipes]